MSIESVDLVPLIYIQILNQYVVHLKLVSHVNYTAMKFLKIWIYCHHGVWYILQPLTCLYYI